MTPEHATTDAALAMRRDFDASFALARTHTATTTQGLLAMRLGGTAFALRVDEMAGLLVDRVVVPLPSPLPELLGIAGIRGRATPVYDLSVLFGGARQAAPRWLVLVRCVQTLAFAFEAFDAHVVATPDQLVPAAEGATHLHDAVRCAHGVLGIIRLPSVVDEVQRRVDAVRLSPER